MMSDKAENGNEIVNLTYVFQIKNYKLIITQTVKITME